MFKIPKLNKRTMSMFATPKTRQPQMPYFIPKLQAELVLVAVFKQRILDDRYIKHGQSTMLKRLRKKTLKMSQSFEATIKVLDSEFQDKFQKHEKHFSEVSVQNDKAVKAFVETEERCRKIVADCSEESTRQQLMHIPELVTHMQQGHTEQLKRLRETTNAVCKKFDRVIQAWKLYFEGGGEMLGQEMEELMGDYESSDSD